ncbi:MAG: hypothetical protein U0Z53_21300 [Blastocatellia bacterium]
MPISRDDDQYPVKAQAASAGFGDNSSDPYATGKLILQCIRCNAPVEGVICGRKSPCPSCGFPYPLGDCSDLAEN